MSKSFLLIDDEVNIRKFVKLAFSEKAYTVYLAKDASEAFKIIENHHLDLIITDKKLPDIDGLDLIKEIRKKNADIAILMITAFGDVDVAVAAMKEGAFDFLAKPFSIEDLNQKIKPIFERIDLENERDALRAERRSKRFSEIIGDSEEIRIVFDLIEQVAKTSSTVLIQGETGTGKELVARAVHNQSERKGHPFIAINCTTLSENMLESELFGYEKGAFTDAKELKKGLFETANKGSIFFDEIGDMSLNLQAKLLRVLQDKRIRRLGGTVDIDVDVRIITATHRQLDKMVSEALFREDLFFRLNVFPIELPALRDRKKDIPLLVDFFMDAFSKEFGKKRVRLRSSAKHALLNYPWEGNIRELKNVLERIMILSQGKDVELKDLPKQFKENVSKKAKLENFKVAKYKIVKNFEVNYIEELLENCKGNVSQASKLAEMDRTAFQRLIRKHKIDANLYR